MDLLSANDNTLLKIAVKGMNDTIQEYRLVPGRVLFEIIPRLTVIASDIHKQKERMDITAKAQMEMNAIIAKRRISSDLNRK